MVTSEEAGAKKPSREIFDYAVKRAGAEASSSAMIGDDLENDVHAALAAGFARAVWFNPSGSQGDVSDSRISVVKSLEELAGIF